VIRLIKESTIGLASPCRCGNRCYLWAKDEEFPCDEGHSETRYYVKCDRCRIETAEFRSGEEALASWLNYTNKYVVEIEID